MLQETRKGTMKMSDYLSNMKNYFDNLQLAGYPMDMRSFISYVVVGLDDEYTSIVCVIRSQELSWSKIQFELLSFEQHYERIQAHKEFVSMNLVQAEKPKNK